jgi:hypothetical protein
MIVKPQIEAMAGFSIRIPAMNRRPKHGSWISLKIVDFMSIIIASEPKNTPKYECVVF